MGVEAVIFDWEGTVVDYGALKTYSLLKKTYKTYGIEIKKSNFKNLKVYDYSSFFNIELKKKEVKNINEKLRDNFYKKIDYFSDPIKEIKASIKRLKGQNIKIGSISFMNRDFIKKSFKGLDEKGYKPDYVISLDEVSENGAYLEMIYKNMMKFGIQRVKEVVKVSGSIKGIVNAKNAGLWAVGVVYGSRELGLSEKEIKSFSKSELRKMVKDVKIEMISSGADFVINDMTELDMVIEIINRRTELY